MVKTPALGYVADVLAQGMSLIALSACFVSPKDLGGLRRDPTQTPTPRPASSRCARRSVSVRFPAAAAAAPCHVAVLKVHATQAPLLTGDIPTIVGAN